MTSAISIKGPSPTEYYDRPRVGVGSGAAKDKSTTTVYGSSSPSGPRYLGVTVKGLFGRRFFRKGNVLLVHEALLSLSLKTKSGYVKSASRLLHVLFFRCNL